MKLVPGHNLEPKGLALVATVPFTVKALCGMFNQPQNAERLMESYSGHNSLLLKLEGDRQCLFFQRDNLRSANTMISCSTGDKMQADFIDVLRAFNICAHHIEYKGKDINPAQVEHALAHRHTPRKIKPEAP